MNTKNLILAMTLSAACFQLSYCPPKEAPKKRWVKKEPPAASAAPTTPSTPERSPGKRIQDGDANRTPGKKTRRVCFAPESPARYSPARHEGEEEHHVYRGEEERFQSKIVKEFYKTFGALKHLQETPMRGEYLKLMSFMYLVKEGICQCGEEDFNERGGPNPEYKLTCLDCQRDIGFLDQCMKILLSVGIICFNQDSEEIKVTKRIQTLENLNLRNIDEQI